MRSSKVPAYAILGSAATLLGACASTPSTTPAASAPASAMAVAAAVPAGAAAEDSVWYAAKLNDGAADREFWWSNRTGKDGSRYTLIAGALASLPSSAPGKGGIEAPEQTDQSPKPIIIEYCKYVDEKTLERHTLHNGFLSVLVEPHPSAEAAPDFTQMKRWIPWPIIVRTPSHPGGAYAGMFVLLTIQDSSGATIRESILRPSQAKLDSCKDAAGPDDTKALVHVTGGCCGEEDQFFLREVEGVHNIKWYVEQRKVDPGDPEAAFLIDVCTFTQKAREVIAATPSPTKIEVSPCTR